MLRRHVRRDHSSRHGRAHFPHHGDRQQQLRARRRHGGPHQERATCAACFQREIRRREICRPKSASACRCRGGCWPHTRHAVRSLSLAVSTRTNRRMQAPYAARKRFADVDALVDEVVWVATWSGGSKHGRWRATVPYVVACCSEEESLESRLALILDSCTNLSMMAKFPIAFPCPSQLVNALAIEETSNSRARDEEPFVIDAIDGCRVQILVRRDMQRIRGHTLPRVFDGGVLAATRSARSAEQSEVKGSQQGRHTERCHPAGSCP